MNSEIAVIRQMVSQSFIPKDAKLDVAGQRASMEAFASVIPTIAGTELKPVVLGGTKGERIVAPGASSARTILYLHGGGYVVGSSNSHRPLAAQYSAAADATVYNMDYPLAPEHPFPAGLDAAVAAYRALLGQGIKAKNIVIAGDSAGGGLSLATALKLRDLNLEQPAGLFLMSPWSDLTLSGDSIRANAARDPMVRQDLLDQMSAMYLVNTPGTNPHASPAFADFNNLPPILIHVGTEELLLSDSIAVAHKAGLAGVECTLMIAPEMIHVWHAFFPMLATARTAIADAGAWIKAKTT